VCSPVSLLVEAEEDLLAFDAFPADHWAKLRSTNPLERVNREIGRRTDDVGIFPNDRSLIRLAASVVIEQNDEWLVGRRYLSNHSLDAVLDHEKKDNDRKETRELTPQPEQPTNGTTSYTTPWDLTSSHAEGSNTTRAGTRTVGGDTAGIRAAPGAAMQPLLLVAR
jgi:hypothetical protein